MSCAELTINSWDFMGFGGISGDFTINNRDLYGIYWDVAKNHSDLVEFNGI